MEKKRNKNLKTSRQLYAPGEEKILSQNISETDYESRKQAKDNNKKDNH